MFPVYLNARLSDNATAVIAIQQKWHLAEGAVNIVSRLRAFEPI